MPFTVVVFPPNGRSIALPPFSKLATKIVLLIIDPYSYSALCLRHLNILFTKKLQILFLVVSLYLTIGFMIGSSTLQQLLVFFKDIYEYKAQTDEIYLDFSKAFD